MSRPTTSEAGAIGTTADKTATGDPDPVATPANNTPIRVFRRIWYGRELQQPTYHIAGVLFWRMLGLVYLIAFISLWIQISGLVGDNGILPVSDFLDSARQHFADQTPPASPVWNIPTLVWFSPHDGLLHFLCLAGTALALLVIAGLLPLPSLALLWVIYLSLFHAGQEFLGFQWDVLLLETGFLAIFVAPLAWRSSFLADRHPPRLALWLVWWLLFRLMLESGAVKLTWNDWRAGPDGLPVANSWESLTALGYHYWTQPLPIWTSWYAAQLPAWFQKLSVIGVLFIELVLPWLVFGPRILRYIACGGIILLMLLIAATGNYNFFNFLTMILALTLLDDRIWPQFLRRRIQAQPARVGFWRWRYMLLVPFAGLAIVFGTAQLRDAIAPVPEPRASLESTLKIDQFLLINDYGLFRRMTETRPEIVIEGSADGNDWQPYGFRWKPGDPARRPRLVAPHQPRLDWQMWFEALELEYSQRITGAIDPRYMSPWFRALLQQILEGEPQVTGLLAGNPFPSAPPAYIRVVLYQYRFTTSSERRSSGDWWHREVVQIGPRWSLPDQEWF